MSIPEGKDLHPLTGEKPRAYWYQPGKPPQPLYKNDKFRKGADPATLWYSASDCARLAGKGRRWIVAAIKAGRLVGSKPRGEGKGRKEWAIRGSDFIAFMEGQSDVGALPGPVAVGERK